MKVVFDQIKKKFSEFINNISKKEESKEDKIDLSLSTKVKAIIKDEIQLKDSDIDDYLEKLRLELLKSDVAFDSVDKIIDKIRSNLLNSKVKTSNIEESIKNIIKNSLFDIIKVDKTIDLISLINEKKEKPFVILFIGPNGSGKTTTIAKIAYMLKENNLSVVISASDTFRAAAIEQVLEHANKLGIEVIAKGYGADPASVAFDAIAHAKSKKIDVVLIDTAGRQDSNENLINEVKKINKVSKPDLRIFVGEAIAGNALLEQIRHFSEAIGIDGIILTKIDCDAKGGNTLSILSETKIPILYLGTGESYKALEVYKPEAIIDSIIS